MCAYLLACLCNGMGRSFSIGVQCPVCFFSTVIYNNNYYVLGHLAGISLRCTDFLELKSFLDRKSITFLKKSVTFNDITIPSRSCQMIQALFGIQLPLRWCWWWKTRGSIFGAGSVLLERDMFCFRAKTGKGLFKKKWHFRQDAPSNEGDAFGALWDNSA